MALDNNLKEIIRQEILNDPRSLGYKKYLAYPAQVAALLNNPRNKSVVEKTSILDIWEYLNWLESLQVVGDVQLVKNLILQVHYSGHAATLDATYKSFGGAEGTLNGLRAYGIDVILNSFGVNNYQGDKVALTAVLEEVLLHAVNVGLKKESAIVIPNKIPARVSILFAQIASAPNIVSEKDIADIIKTL